MSHVRRAYKEAVTIDRETYEVIVDHRSKTVYIATGSVNGHYIEGKGSSVGTALRSWRTQAERKLHQN